MEGLYKLLPAKEARFGDLAGLAGRSLYCPSMSYSKEQVKPMRTMKQNADFQEGISQA